MKRFGVIASFVVGMLGASSIAFADRFTALLENLPMQKTDAHAAFSVPSVEPAMKTSFQALGSSDPIAVSMATPFGGTASTANGAVAALQAIAARNPGVALSSASFRAEPDAILAYAPDGADLLRVVASDTPSNGVKAAKTISETPRSLATKLFDTNDQAWRSDFYSDNPLVGSIVASDGSPSDAHSLVKAVKGARYVLLGEIHDNPDHHRLQAGIIRKASDDANKPAVVFEMIPETFSEVLDNINENTPVDLSALAEKLNWSERGWPDFSIYAPIFKAAIDNNLPIKAGNLDRATVRKLSGTDNTSVSARDRARLGLDLPVDPALRQDLMAELEASHCGLLPKAALAPMELAQRLRDGSMAAAMIDAAKDAGSALLIAGSGHARKDRGVPAVIAGLTGDNDAIAVQMVEIASADADRIADYGLSKETPAPFDFTIFTPRANLTDHCAELEAAMKARSDEPAGTDQ